MELWSIKEGDKVQVTEMQDKNCASFIHHTF